MLSCPHMRFSRKLASQLLLHNPEEGTASPHPIKIEELVGKSRFLWKSLSWKVVYQSYHFALHSKIPPGNPSQPGIQCFCKARRASFWVTKGTHPILHRHCSTGHGEEQGVPEETTARCRSLARCWLLRPPPFPQVPWPHHLTLAVLLCSDSSPGLLSVG